ncbi:MAG: septum site-determining protein MinC [Proteobacteria bacterium]|jgi:septum site-determining protein MinC|nr:septum site-determining protein MinC [Pseudomonadota bacterium]
MVIRNNVKFTHASFEYYVLHIGLATDLSQVESKLIDFIGSSNHKENIVLSFDDDLNLESITKIVAAISKITIKLKIQLHSILENRVIHDDKILNFPVINFPKSSKKPEVLFNKTLIINEPIRSGMRIINDGDIVVTSFVSNGAEVIATGNIHIYGELKGKAIAGSAGDKSAKIFALKFTPELISIGGIYRAIDTKIPENLLNNAVMVSLDDKSRLSIVAVKI